MSVELPKAVLSAVKSFCGGRQLFERKAAQSRRTRTSIGEVKGVDTVGEVNIRGVFRPDVGELHRDSGQGGAVPGGLYLEGAGAVSPDFDGDGLYAFAVKILEAADGSVQHVHDIGLLLVSVLSVLGDAGKAAVRPDTAAIAAGIDGILLCEQVAGNIGRIGSFAFQRSAVQTAGGHLHLGDGSVRQEGYFLGHALTAVGGAVGLAVIEDVGFITDPDEAAVVVSAVIHGFAGGFVAADADIVVADDHAFVFKTVIRIPADSKAQLMHHNRGIDEVIQIPKLPDGGGLEELMAFIAGTGTEGLAGHDEDRLLLNGQHVFCQLCAHGAVAGSVHGGTETGIQPGFAVFRDDTGIELGFIPGPVAQQAAVLIMHMAVEFIFAGGRVANGNCHAALLVQHIIEVVPAVGTLGDVRSVETGFAFPVVRVIGFLINDTFIAPVSQVVHRGGPADIVVQAEHMAVEAVMGAVDIDPSVEHMGFTVGNIFPSGKIRIESLHIGCPPVYISC